MVKFGPSSTDVLFATEGHTSTLDMPMWLSKKFSLNAFEYPFNLGIRLSDEQAKKIGEQAKKFDVEISAHAPYYINFANPEEEFEQKSISYIILSLKKLKLMGGNRLAVHIGTQGKLARNEALELIKTRLKNLSKQLDEHNLNDVMICFETMGKYSQIGNYEELAPLTNLDSRFNLTLDFGHINCTMQGGLKTEEDYLKIFNDLLKIMPREKVDKIHIHFSKILYNSKGEIKHATFDEFAEPDFEPLSKAIKKLSLNPVIICESKGTQAQDAAKMKNFFEKGFYF